MAKNMMDCRKTCVGAVLSWLAVTLFMILIYLLSSQQGIESNKLSNRVINRIIREVKENLNMPRILIDKLRARRLDYNLLLRKATHFALYFILALLLYVAFAYCGMSAKGCLLTAFILSIAYAFLDEYHQWFVEGRTSRLQDVFIDSSGALFGVFCASLNMLILKKSRKTRN